MIPDRTIAPAIHDAIEFEYRLPPINAATLSNGIPLYWLNAGVQDVVEIDWVFPAGLWYESRPSVAQAVAGLLKNGTSRYTAAQISESLEFYGAQVKAHAGNDYSTVSLYSLTRHLPALLPVMLDILTDAVFPEGELAIYKQNAIQRLLVHLRQCEFVANQRIDAMLYGEQHPYGRFTRKEKIEALDRATLLQFYRAAFHAGSCKMFMAGNIGETEVRLIDTIFGNMSTQRPEPDATAYEPQPATERKERLLNDENGVQGAIRIGRHFPNRKHPDFTPMIVLNTLFGGYFGSRLMSNIREEKGFTYGIHSSITAEQNGGSLIIHTETGRDVTEAAVNEIYAEMEKLCGAPAPEDELLLVKNYLLGNILGDLDGPFSILQRWRTLILNGFSGDQFDHNIRIYKTITSGELQRLAQQYFVTSDFYEVVVI